MTTLADPVTRFGSLDESGEYLRHEVPALSFVGMPLLQGRHRLHSYPAMLHPLLVDSLLDKYGREGDVVLDPFCGSGVTLFQASAKGYRSYGLDINPVALLIARAKTERYSENLVDEIRELDASAVIRDPIDIPDLQNGRYWYTEDVIRDLGRLRYLLKERDYEYSNLLKAAFAFICRDQSLTRNGEFKRYRMAPDRISRFTNKVFSRYFSHLNEMASVFVSGGQPRAESRPMLANSEDGIPVEGEYDLVITSPPYGDSGTTVAYGQYTSFGMQWLDGLIASSRNGYSLDREGLGRTSELCGDLNCYPRLTETVSQIGDRDGKRANEVLMFFNGYYKSIRNVVSGLRRGGRVCYVVGNRTVKGIQIPMDQITASFLEGMSLTFRDISVRQISNKIMPSRNSPSNRAGDTESTMTREYIVVFEKP